MKYLLSRSVLFLLVFSLPSLADTVIGTGGNSPAVTGFSSSSFEWIDNTGNVNATVLSSIFGYNVFGPGNSNQGTGSLLLSNPFTVGAGSSLNVSFSIFTAQNPAFSFNELGFAVLLQNSQIVAILGAARPDGIGHIGDFGSVPGVTFQGPSSGVTATHLTHPGSMPLMTLGSQNYGTSDGPLSCGNNCFTDFNSTYTPGAGTYQILYGSFVYGLPNNHAGGLAVKMVSVPEPTALELFFAALVLFAAAKLLPCMGFYTGKNR